VLVHEPHILLSEYLVFCFNKEFFIGVRLFSGIFLEVLKAGIDLTLFDPYKKTRKNPKKTLRKP